MKASHLAECRCKTLEVLLVTSLWLSSALEVNPAFSKAGTRRKGVVVAGGQRGDGMQQLRGPLATVQQNGAWWIADADNHRIQRCAPPPSSDPLAKAQCQTVAGGNEAGDDDKRIRTPYSVAVTSKDEVYVADTFNNRVQLWLPGAKFGTTVAGGLGVGSSALHVYNPVDVAVDEQRQQLYVLDTGNHRVQRWPLQSSISLSVTGIATSGVVTVAGHFSGVVGSGLGFLNNPMGMYVDFATEDVYVADTRNNRIQLWKRGATMGSTLLASLPDAVYGFCIDAFGSIYIADSSSHTIWKYPGKVVVAGGRDMGSALTQLYEPTHVHVDPDGTLLVTETKNDRISKWLPAPLANDVVCTLSKSCKITLKSGNMLPSNMLAIVEKMQNEEVSPCGQEACRISTHHGGKWKILWSSIVRPSPPLVEEVGFDFGTAMFGVHGDFVLCWGAIVSPEVSGDCSSLPVHVGQLTMKVLLEDLNYEGAIQCSRDSICRLNLAGYGLPRESQLKVIPHDGTCGRKEQFTKCFVESIVPIFNFSQPFFTSPSDSANFSNLSIAEQQKLQEAAMTTGNLSTFLDFEVGSPKCLGHFKLCYCPNDGGCRVDRDFSYDAGVLTVRGANTNQLFLCREQVEECKINITGVYLLPGDAILLHEHDGKCGTKAQETTMKKFWHGRAQVQWPPVANHTPHVASEVTFNLGVASVQGLYQVCYCASYDSGSGVCKTDSDFAQPAGQLKVRVVKGNEEYGCIVGQLCNVTVHGSRLASTDAVSFYLGNKEPCGKSSVVLPSVGLGVNVYLPKSGNNLEQRYDLGRFDEPSRASGCYCATFDMANGEKCVDNNDYFQTAGTLTIRGPNPWPQGCVTNRPCDVTIKGVALSTSDRIQVRKAGGTCSAGFNNSDLITNLVNASSSGSGRDPTVSFKLGKLPRGNFVLCYCPQFNGRDGNPAPCSSDSELVSGAGDLLVRGARPGQFFECIVGQKCDIMLAGWGLDVSDYILMTPVLNIPCGRTTGVQGIFEPMSRLQGSNAGSITGHQFFQYRNVQRYGRFRICYCVGFAGFKCKEDKDFDHVAGLIVVKGLAPIKDYACPWNTNCQLAIGGFGLKHTVDAIQLQYHPYSCGTGEIIVQGIPLDSVHAKLLGLYRIQSDKFDEKQWYKSENDQAIFFDNFRSRWNLGPISLMGVANLPTRKYGIAWADGLLAHTPAKLESVGSNWFVWKGSDFVDWEEMSGMRSVSPRARDSFKENPSFKSIYRVPDTELGVPYLRAQTFELGPAAQQGAFNICYCSESDGDDFKETVCDSDDEYITLAGSLIVGTVFGYDRFFCAVGVPCNLRVTQPHALNGKNTSLVFIDYDKVCHHHVQEDHEGKAFEVALPLSGKGEQGPFPRGAQLVLYQAGNPLKTGHFRICVCEDFESPGDEDSVPCSSPVEFFQSAGVVSVVEYQRIDIQLGQKISFELSGREMSTQDLFQLLPQGSQCEDVLASNDPRNKIRMSTTTPPLRVFGEGKFPNRWAEVEMKSGAQGSFDAGAYMICMCPKIYGMSECDPIKDFSISLGVLRVNSIAGKQAYATLTSNALLKALPIDDLEEAATRLVRDVNLRVTFENVTRTALLEGLSSTTAPNEQATDISVVVHDIVEESMMTTTMKPTSDSNTPERGLQGINTLTLMVSFSLEQEGSSTKALMDLLTGDLPSKISSKLASLPDETLQAFRVKSLILESIGPDVAAESFERHKHFRCVSGALCQLGVHGTKIRELNSLLVLDDKAECGITRTYNTSTEAVQRATQVIPPNFTVQNPIVGGISFTTTSQTFSLGKARDAGAYSLCYCYEEASVQLGKKCHYNMDFFQVVGSLTIAGLRGTPHMLCVAGQKCWLKLTGVDLSAWDKIMVVAPEAIAGVLQAECGETAIPDPSFPNNVVPTDVRGSSTTRGFTFGRIWAKGDFKVCYCANYRADPLQKLPCQKPADFTMLAAFLAVRGPEGGVKASCTTTENGTDANCFLQFKGVGLWPGADMASLIPRGDMCGIENDLVSFAGDASATLLWPNPLPTTAGTPLEDWPKGPNTRKMYTSELRADILGVGRPGRYTICFCVAEQSGSCQEAQNYQKSVGELFVRGARSDLVFGCVGGQSCKIHVLGYALTRDDKVKFIRAGAKCTTTEPSEGIVLRNPAPAIVPEENTSDINATLTEDQVLLENWFDFGMAFDNGPITLRSCYCAAQSSDSDGIPCNLPEDFTHSAGLLSMLQCPTLPENVMVTPNPEDLSGNPTQPGFVLLVVPPGYCSEPSMGQAVRVDGPALQPTDARLITNSQGRCYPNVDIVAPKMSSIHRFVIDVSVVEPGAPHIDHGWPRPNRRKTLQRTKMIQDGTYTFPVVPVAEGMKIRVAVRVNDTSRQTYYCENLEIGLQPFGCASNSAQYIGMVTVIYFAYTLLLSILAHILIHIVGVNNLRMQVPHITYPECLKQLPRKLLRSLKSCPGNTLMYTHAYTEYAMFVLHRRCKRRFKKDSGNEKHERRHATQMVSQRSAKEIAALERSERALERYDEEAAVISNRLEKYRGVGGKFETWGNQLDEYKEKFTESLPLQKFRRVSTMGSLQLAKYHGRISKRFSNAPALQKTSEPQAWADPAVAQLAKALMQKKVLLFLIITHNAAIVLPMITIYASHGEEVEPGANTCKMGIPYKDGAIMWLSFIAMFVAQLVVLVSAIGRKEAFKKQSVRSLSIYVASQLKMHLDIIFPMIAYRCYCELWRSALVVIVIGILFMQALLPSIWFLWAFYKSRQAGSAEERERNGLVCIFGFLRVARMRILSDPINPLVEARTGHDITIIKGFWEALRFFFQILDLMAMQIWFLAFYATNASGGSRTAVIFSMLLGLILSHSPALLVSILPILQRITYTWAQRSICLFMFIFYRTTLFWPVALSCPALTVPWEGVLSEWVIWSNSQLLGWVAMKIVVVIREKLTAVMRKSVKNGYDVEIEDMKPMTWETVHELVGNIPVVREVCKIQSKKMDQNHVHQARPLFTQIQKLVDMAMEELIAHSKEPLYTFAPKGDDKREIQVGFLKEVQRHAQRLQVDLQEISQKPTMAQKILPLEDTIVEVEALYTLIHDQNASKTFKDVVVEVLALARQQLGVLLCSLQGLRAIKSFKFQRGDLEKKAMIMRNQAPLVPPFVLIHWSVLDKLERLPRFDEPEYHTTPEEAYLRHGDKALSCVVLHRWSRKFHPDDKDNTKAQRLVEFVLWYQESWQQEFEIYFWIDFSCLPSAELQEKETKDKLRMRQAEMRRASTTPASIGSKRSSTDESVVKISDEQHQTGWAARNLRRMSVTGIDSKIGYARGAEMAYCGVPFFLAASDLMLLYEAGDTDSRSWLRAELALAYTFAPAGVTPYSISRHFKAWPKASRVKKVQEEERAKERWALSRRLTQQRLSIASMASKSGGLLALRDAARGMKGNSKDTPPAPPAFPEAPAPQSSQNIAQSYASNARGSISMTLSNLGSKESTSSRGSLKNNEERPPLSNRIRDLQRGDLVEPRVEKRQLKNPLAWTEAHLSMPERDRVRIVQIMEVCASDPPWLCSGDMFRDTIDFSPSSQVRIWNLSPPEKENTSHDDNELPQARTAFIAAVKEASKQREEAENDGNKDEDEDIQGDTSDSSSDEDYVPVHRPTIAAVKSARQKRQTLTGEKAALALEAEQLSNTQTSWPSQEPKEKLNRTAPTPLKGMAKRPPRPPDSKKKEASPLNKLNVINALAGTVGNMKSRRISELTLNAAHEGANVDAALRTSGTLISRIRFHKDFHSASIGFIGQETVAGLMNGSSSGGGGLVVTAFPFRAHAGVAPWSPAERGVYFEVEIEEVESSWKDILGIGFTSEDPEKWPKGKPPPRFASNLKNSWLWGYGGSWVFQGQSSMMKAGDGEGFYRRLRPGDVVGALAKGREGKSPTEFAIFINGLVVAKRSGASFSFPDSITTPLWGVLDMDGACSRVRLLARDRPSPPQPPDLPGNV